MKSELGSRDVDVTALQRNETGTGTDREATHGMHGGFLARRRRIRETVTRLSPPVYEKEEPTRVSWHTKGEMSSVERAIDTWPVRNGFLTLS